MHVFFLTRKQGRRPLLSGTHYCRHMRYTKRRLLPIDSYQQAPHGHISCLQHAGTMTCPGTLAAGVKTHPAADPVTSSRLPAATRLQRYDNCWRKNPQVGLWPCCVSAAWTTRRQSLLQQHSMVRYDATAYTKACPGSRGFYPSSPAFNLTVGTGHSDQVACTAACRLLAIRRGPAGGTINMLSRIPHHHDPGSPTVTPAFQAGHLAIQWQ